MAGNNSGWPGKPVQFMASACKWLRLALTCFGFMCFMQKQDPTNDNHFLAGQCFIATFATCLMRRALYFISNY